jgi:hypothetical protein
MALLFSDIPGWSEELEAEVLKRLGIHDLLALRAACKMARATASRLVKSLLIDSDELGRAELDSSCPEVGRLVIIPVPAASSEDGDVLDECGRSIMLFALEHAGALQRLRVLDLRSGDYVISASSALAALASAHLTQLRRLNAHLDLDVGPRAWRALSCCPLRELHLRVDGLVERDHGLYGGLAAWAPRLEVLAVVVDEAHDYDASISSLAALTHLRSLSLHVGAFGASDCGALGGGLTFLHLHTWGPHVDLQACLAATAQLKQLRELELGFEYAAHAPLDWDQAGLSSLQQLTRLRLADGEDLSVQLAAALPGLRSLEGGVGNQAAELLEALQPLQLDRLRLDYLHVNDPSKDTAPPLPCRVLELGMHIVDYCITSLPGWFEWAALQKLDLDGTITTSEMPQHMPDIMRQCLQLRSLSFGFGGELPLQILAAMAALPRLQQLRLRRSMLTQPYLLAACKQLRQLTLREVSPVGEELVGVLLTVLPQLRVLRLLQCEGASSRARCRALLGQLQRHDVRVDVVPSDGSWWLSEELGGRWDEALAQ